MFKIFMVVISLKLIAMYPPLISIPVAVRMAKSQKEVKYDGYIRDAVTKKALPNFTVKMALNYLNEPQSSFTYNLVNSLVDWFDLGFTPTTYWRKNIRVTSDEKGRYSLDVIKKYQRGGIRKIGEYNFFGHYLDVKSGDLFIFPPRYKSNIDIVEAYRTNRLDEYKVLRSEADEGWFVGGTEHWQKYFMKQQEKLAVEAIKEKGHFFTRELPEIPEMVFIPTGEVWLGSDYFDDQFHRPRIKVKVDAFYISKYEITIDQVIKIHNEKLKNIKIKNFPIRESVLRSNRKNYEKYIFKQLLNKTGIYFRFPTEAEWNRAAKGNSKLDFRINKKEVLRKTNIGKYYYLFNTSEQKFPVGFNEKDKSVFGIYDMYGNAREIVGNEKYEKILKDDKRKKFNPYDESLFDYLTCYILKSNCLLNFNLRFNDKTSFLEHLESDKNILYYGLGFRQELTDRSYGIRLVVSAKEYEEYLKRINKK